MQLASFQKFGKTLIFVFLLLVVLAAAVFMGRNASSYFAKASACAVENARAVSVSANSAVVTWTTGEKTRGKVEYGTDSANLSFSQIEGEEGTTHNVPLTLLTPNTTYYFLINFGDSRCDSSGMVCTDSCAPWNFTTTGITPQEEVEEPLATPGSGEIPSPSPSASPQLSNFCEQVSGAIGQNSKDAKNWPTYKKFDLDANGMINSRDVFACQKEGK